MLEIIPLGGLGEFGMNLMVYRHGEDCVVVDAGMMFPGAEHLGVDVVIPDLSFLDQCGNLLAVVLTHGHEDHIGALPFLLERHDVPVYCAPYTRGLVKRRLEDRGRPGRAELRALPLDGKVVDLGPFAIEALPVAHSIPQSVMLALRTPAGTVLHTADFKLDPDPLDGVGTDISERLERLGREGVLVLLSDSTNADVPGFTPGERTVADGLHRVVSDSPRRVLVTTFASNIHRIQQVVNVAVRNRRRVALVGSSIRAHAEIAEQLGLLSFPAGVKIEPDRAMDLRPERTLFLVTGSQGEPMSALARIAVGRHRDVKVEDGDRVIHSARIIPGNEKSISRMINHLLRNGAETLTARDVPVHVSGHPAREELRLVLNQVRPRFFIPIHGEYRQLRAHATLASEAGWPKERLVLAESGDVVAVDESGASVVDRVQVGHVFIDPAMEQVDLSVLRDRRRIAGDGVVVPVIALGGSKERDTFEIVTRGFLSEDGENGLMEEVRDVTARLLSEASPEERSDEALLKARVQTELKRFLRRRAGRRPLILPVIMEL